LKQKIPFLQERLLNLFEFRQDVKNDVLTYIWSNFCKKSGRGATLPSAHPSPLPLGFIATTDHSRGQEVPAGCGPQSGAVPVSIPVSFRSRAIQSAEFSVESALSLFLSGPLGSTFLGKFLKL
jgi:hypothetical protein